MNGLLHKQHHFFGNMINVVGVCLCFYFVYHCLAGNRSVFRLEQVKSQVVSMSLGVSDATSLRKSLEQKVLAMRPDTIDGDFIDGRVRLVLGYQGVGELLLLNH